MLRYPLLVYVFLHSLVALAAGADSATQSAPEWQAFISDHCLDCHDGDTREGGFALDELLSKDVAHATDGWERVVRKLAARQMPPPDMPRPTEVEFNTAVDSLTQTLDLTAAARPKPGRSEPLRRLNRTEYRNAIRDLLALEIDVDELLPADEASHGFDNITVTGLSPALLDRYVTAAQKISRLAVGGTRRESTETTIRVRPDITQDTHIAGTPLGTRGGTVVTHNFPREGLYEVQVWLMRDRNEELEGLRETHELEVALDRERLTLFTIEPPPRGTSDKIVDADLRTQFQAGAGPHELSVAFLAKSASLLETVRQPLNVHYNYYRHPRIGPAVYQVSVRGPIESSHAGTSPSRERIFVCRPQRAEQQDACAEEILTNLVRRAYRRPVQAVDLETPLEFFRQGRAAGGFEAGIEKALAAILVSPQFLFRVERDPPNTPSGNAYHIDDIELASRLSFFLWSSIPDDELLDLAAAGRLRDPAVLTAQVERMLADERSQSLVSNFAGQWLYLRNLDSIVPDMRLYPDFDDNLRQAMRQETELFFASMLREDRSVLDLLRADYTFVNERLAKHYGIPHIYGSRFRKVELDQDSHRGGLLRHASILTVTSYATRTSPVIRGHWVLKNLVGAPPPPPPPDVPALEENTVAANLPIRARLEQHRANAACAGCHNLIDPVGFALENYDAVGRWRDTEAGAPLDASGGFPDGSIFTGVQGLEDALLARPELFVQTLVEKLLTFALGRGVESSDAPAVRKIVRQSRRHDYRLSQLVVGIANSVPFRMREAQ